MTMPIPRYVGLSDPVPRTASPARLEFAQRQALHRMLLSWAESAGREQWRPFGAEGRVVHTPDTFILDKQLYEVTAIGELMRPADDIPPGCQDGDTSGASTTTAAPQPDTIPPK